MKEGWLTMDDANKSGWLSAEEHDYAKELIGKAESAETSKSTSARSSARNASQTGAFSAEAAPSAFPRAADVDKQPKPGPKKMPQSESDPSPSTGGASSAAQLSGRIEAVLELFPKSKPSPPSKLIAQSKSQPETEGLLAPQSASNTDAPKDAASSPPQRPPAGSPTRSSCAKSESDANRDAAVSVDQDAAALPMPKRMPGPPLTKRVYPRTPEVRQFLRETRRRTKSAERPMTERADAFNPPPTFPNPNRVPPFVAVVLDGEHSVPPLLDFDWTLHAEKTIELRRREERNVVVKEALQAGNTVAFRSSGNSLHPWVHSGDSCTYVPVNGPMDIRLHDVVFCEVQPGNRFYAHVVKKIVTKRGRLRFTIANLEGRENGWCEMEHIYGKLVHVEH
jgi:hypothetical protein